MVGKFTVNLNGSNVGSCLIEREGLYYRIICRCDLPDRGKYDLWFIANDLKHNLGVCVPVENGYGLTVRIPVKKFTEAEGSFILKRKESNETLCFMDETTEMFPILNALPELRIRKVNQCIAVYIMKDQGQD